MRTLQSQDLILPLLYSSNASAVVIAVEIGLFDTYKAAIARETAMQMILPIQVKVKLVISTPMLNASTLGENAFSTTRMGLTRGVYSKCGEVPGISNYRQ